jgi:steroid 5-alpha reductase family enzyme
VSWGPLLVNLAVTAGLVAVLMLATFLYAMRTQVHAIMDTIWPLGFVLIAGVSFLLSAGSGVAGRRGLVLVLTAVWGSGSARTFTRATAGRARTSGTPRCCGVTEGAWPRSCCATSTGCRAG